MDTAASVPASVSDALDAVLGPSTAWGPPVTRAPRDRLLPALHAAHDAAGWLSPGALDEIARRLGLGRAEVYGVASFYGSFTFRPRPRRVRRVCVDVVCLAAGAAVPDPGQPGMLASACLGRCDRAPAVLDTEGGTEIDAETTGEPAAPAVAERGFILRRVGVCDPRSLADYRAHGGYRSLERARALGPEAVRRAVRDSGLSGRGGAAFPAGRKWDAVARAAGSVKYVVANVDESEPGTFKDRVLVEHDPFALVEAMTIAAHAVGAQRGYVYVRDEYPRARQAVEQAVAAAGAAGLLGDDAAELGGSFHIEVRRGAGAYVCGEETALLNSIEGRRGEPRTRPPFPADAGLFGGPTLVHNAETLANVLRILDPDGPHDESRLFAVSGSVARPGVYEMPLGITLRDLLTRAGGLPGERPPKAVLLGGAAGSFVGPEHLDVPLTVEGTRTIGATLGSGAVIVLDDGVDLEAVVLRIAAFFREESCGQCVPCRVGTVRQEEALHRLASGQPLGSRDDELTRLRDVGLAMRDASICGLGQTAWNAIASAIDRFEVFTR
jgi:NADH-quinone oxidoreductase subunit F